MDDKRYNSFHKRYIFLFEGEEFCKKCNGKGKLPKPGKVMGKEGYLYLRCNICNGEGKLDWIEKVTGKKVSLIGYEA